VIIKNLPWEQQMESNAKSITLDNLARGILPLELWVEIFPYLNVASIKNCLRSCKAFEYLFLPLLAAKRNYFMVGRVMQYSDRPFDESGKKN